jgi:ABC-type transport system involved in multi-copper enzyme maturation permease subunit
MFIVFLLVTTGIAWAVSFIIVRMFATPMQTILNRIVGDSISYAWLRYLKFAIYVAGISSGVRVWEMQRYVTASRIDDRTKPLELTSDKWTFEIYRTVMETVQGITWVLLGFFATALVAYIVVRALEDFAARKNLPPGASVAPKGDVPPRATARIETVER